MDEEVSSYPAPQKRPIVRKLAKEPSWLLLGFLLGAAFVWLLPSEKAGNPSAGAPGDGTAVSAAGEGVAGTPQTAGQGVGQAAGGARALPVRRLSTIEAVFESWGQYAIWEHDLTQVALWSAEHGGYAECYEVMRSGDVLYFRSIPRLTRPVINYGTQITSPLLYTETETTRAARAGGLLVPVAAPGASVTGTPPATTTEKARPARKRAHVAPQEPSRVEVTLPGHVQPPAPQPIQPPDTLFSADADVPASAQPPRVVPPPSAGDVPPPAPPRSTTVPPKK